MKQFIAVCVVFAFGSVSMSQAQSVKSNIAYAEPANERQMLDVYAPVNAKNVIGRLKTSHDS